MLGGTQSLHTNSYDEALALPTEEAVRIALRTQQIIAHETGVTNTVDPLGGSYFVEALTDRMEAAAYGYFAKIDELGGMVEAIKHNFPQREIADAAFQLPAGDRRRRAHRRRRQPLPAATTSRSPTPAHRPRRSSSNRSAASRPSARTRDSARRRAALAALRTGRRQRPQPDAAAARRARAHATEGEIVQALQRVFGTYTETPVF